MSFDPHTGFAEHLAAHLAANNIGQWNSKGVYKTNTPPPIFLGRIPENAGVSMAINVYGDDRYRSDSSPDLLVQIRVRGDRDPRTGSKIADQIFRLLHDESHYVLDNVTKILLSRRHLRAPEEQDTNGRWYRIDSYTFTLNPGATSD